MGLNRWSRSKIGKCSVVLLLAAAFWSPSSALPP